MIHDECDYHRLIGPGPDDYGRSPEAVRRRKAQAAADVIARHARAVERAERKIVRWAIKCRARGDYDAHAEMQLTRAVVEVLAARQRAKPKNKGARQ